VRYSFRFISAVSTLLAKSLLCGYRAFWSNGPNWPAGGEIDILEGVNDYTNNQATLHTAPGCHLTSNERSTLNITGDVIDTTNCASEETKNAGCGIRARDTNSFGAALNGIGGGVYASGYHAILSSKECILTETQCNGTRTASLYISSRDRTFLKICRQRRRHLGYGESPKPAGPPLAVTRGNTFTTTWPFLIPRSGEQSRLNVIVVIYRLMIVHVVYFV
jgi:hypothetical protein